MADGERLGASFTLDVTDLKAGLTQANRLIRESEAEFRTAAAGIENWTKSEEGLQKRQSTLNDQIDIQKKKIAALVEEKQRVIEKMKSEGKSSEEIEKATDKLNKQITTESKNLDKLESELQKTDDALDEMDDCNHQVILSSAEASDGFTVMKGALANLVAEGFSKAISAAKDFAKEMITSAAEVKAQKSQYEQAFGEMTDSADEMIDRIASSTGILRERLTGTASQIYSFARSSGATTAEAMKLTEEALIATADSAAYYDKSLEDSAETLQSFLKGNFANDAALGVSATEFTRNAKSMELFKKEYKDLSEIEKQKVLLKMVTDSQKLSGAMGQAERESDGFENVMGNINETWRQFQATVGTPFLEALIPILKDVTDGFVSWKNSINWNTFGKTVTNKIKGIIKEAKTLGKNVLPTIKTALKTTVSVVEFAIKNFKTLATIVGVGVTMFKSFQAALAIKSAISAATSAVGALSASTTLATKAQVGLNAAMSANPIGAVLTAVGLLTAGIALLVTTQKNAITHTDLLNESQRETVEAANTAAQSYRENKAAADEMAAGEIANIDYAKQLWTELETLADKNGKVQEGYEGRASFILNELNNALGTEYKMNGDMIESYKKIAGEIDNIIEKKRAQILLDAYQGTYEEAVKNVSEAEKARATQAQEVALWEEKVATATQKAEQAQKDYQASTMTADSRSMDKALSAQRAAEKELKDAKRMLDEKTAAYNSSATAVQGYYDSITAYESASTLATKGKTQEAIDALSAYSNGFKTASNTATIALKEGKDAQLKILEQQVVDTEVNLQVMKAEYAAAASTMTAEEKKQAELRIKNAQKQADDAKVEFKKVGGNITEGMAEGSKDKVWKLTDSMNALIEKAVAAAKKAAAIKSPSKLLRKEVGLFLGLGVAKGIDDSTSDVIASAKRQIRAIEGAYDSNGLALGIDNGFRARDSRSGAIGGVVINQTNNYSQAHSRLELYKSKQQTAAAVRLAMAGGV